MHASCAGEILVKPVQSVLGDKYGTPVIGNKRIPYFLHAAKVPASMDYFSSSIWQNHPTNLHVSCEDHWIASCLKKSIHGIHLLSPNLAFFIITNTLPHSKDLNCRSFLTTGKSHPYTHTKPDLLSPTRTLFLESISNPPPSSIHTWLRR
ncbi:hypothetical protein RJT34_20295 [Clitoria ternatea]|uniref:Uncharacterized protein n=1 Tax=Clitoria ternatea TaxID=43366 RepID=A0AAN9ISY6_CLITE